MLRIAKVQNIPVNAIIVCASCRKAIYVVTGNSLTGIKIKNLNRKSPSQSKDYRLLWCWECSRTVQQSLMYLYIPPIPVDDLLNDRVTLGRRIMAFEQEVR